MKVKNSIKSCARSKRILVINQVDWYRVPRHAVGFWYFTFRVSFPSSACKYIWKSFDESLFEDKTNYLTEKNHKTRYIR